MNPQEIAKIGDEIELSYGYSLPAHSRSLGIIPVFGSNGQIGWHNEAAVNGPGIIVGRKGSVGEVVFSQQSFCPIDTTYYVINRKNHNWKYLYYVLKQLGLTSLSSHSTVPGLNREDVYALFGWFPSIELQNKISLLLTFIESLITKEESALSCSISLKRSTLHKLFTCGLRGEPQKETEIGPVPESWGVLSLSEIASLERGRFMHRPRNEPRFYGGKMPFIQTGDVVRSNGSITEYVQTINEDGVNISRVFPRGTILITIAANIGYTGILQFDAACPDSLIAITPNNSINTHFLHYYLQTQQPKMDQAAPKGTQKNINIQFLTPWLVPIPAKCEQQEIVSILSALDNKIQIHREKKPILEKLFHSLLHKLMTGEIRIDDIDLSALESVKA